jgi:hypothetical protein
VLGALVDGGSPMRLAARRFGLCFLFLLGVASWSASVSQAFSEPELAGPSSLAGGLVVPGVQLLDEGQQLLSQREARRVNPVAVQEREASRTRFEHLDDAHARKEAAIAFPGAIDELTGGPPRLPAGQRVVAYPRDNVAQVDLGGGKRAVVESTEAMAVEVAPGRREPLDLGLASAGSGFEPVRPAVGVVIPRRLSDGVRLPAVGVALAPVSAQGVPLGRGRRCRGGRECGVCQHRDRLGCCRKADGCWF